RTWPLMALIIGPAAAAAQSTTGAVGPIHPKFAVIGEIRDSVCSEVAPSPVMRTLVACTSRNGLQVSDLANHTSTMLIANMYAGDLAWSPTGDRIAFYWQSE